RRLGSGSTIRQSASKHARGRERRRNAADVQPATDRSVMAGLMAPLPGMRCVTDSGIEVPVVTTEQMREIDRIAIDETGPNLFQMMENAGRNLALQVMDILGGKWNSASVVVLAGGGGNGGGGICAARHLANRDVDGQLCLAPPPPLSPVAAV